GFEGRDPYKDYVNLNKELRLYSKELMKKPHVIALNKCDIDGAKENIKRFKKHIRGRRVFVMSAVTGEGIKELLIAVYKNMKSLKKNVKK
ncbi:MAG: hypothetical protein PHV48_06915, partial [Candidatus Omnitrophica bacterium]|nr:hypothetical protein [Candidatus Omnitrophota bacterium]